MVFPLHFTRRMLYTPVSSSNEAHLCGKCDHLLDCDENSSLFLYCWRYFTVWTLLPLHFTRRMLCTPFLASKQAQLCTKYDHLCDSDEKLSVISLLLEIFRCLYAFSMAFYFPNDMQAVFSVNSSLTVRKMRLFTRFWQEAERYIAIVEDITPFEGYYHCISRAEWYARNF